MSARKQRFLAFAMRLLGLLMIVIDLLKSGRSITGLIPQTPAWDKVNDLVYVIEAFVGGNVGKLLPGHAWAVLGVALFIIGVIWKLRTGGQTRGVEGKKVATQSADQKPGAST